MRLWTLKPSLLDCKGLLALWREGLLAMAVLDGKTKGYKNHPQLERFKACRRPSRAVAQYLWYVRSEAQHREYSFDSTKLPPDIGDINEADKIAVTSGQVFYEFTWLRQKLALRGQSSKESQDRYNAIVKIGCHDLPSLVSPMFKVVNGDAERWERVVL